eukprot:5277678-Amphidinium_carterae.1
MLCSVCRGAIINDRSVPCTKQWCTTKHKSGCASRPCLTASAASDTASEAIAAPPCATALASFAAFWICFFVAAPFFAAADLLDIVSKLCCQLLKEDLQAIQYQAPLRAVMLMQIVTVTPPITYSSQRH